MNKRNAVIVGLLIASASMLSLMMPGAPVLAQQRGRGGATAAPAAPIRRTADGKPDLSGFYVTSGSGGANYGLEKHSGDFLTPGTQGIVVDPPDGKLPYQPWARAERINRELPERGYDDPTAHCFVAGVPRSMYTPSPYQIIQPPGYVVLLFERMSWRQIPLDGRPHLPDTVRLWQGDAVGHWEGDTLVVDTTNLNGKTWLNEVGDVMSYDAHIVERFIPKDANTVTYQATVTDKIAYTAPWTIEFNLRRQQDEVIEVACHEDNGDLQHLKDVRDAARAEEKHGTEAMNKENNDMNAIVKKTGLAGGFTVLAMALAAGSVFAHHSFTAEYDENKPVKLNGKVTEVSFANPHAWMHIDVRDEKTGKVVNWALETGGANALIRRGWRKEDLKFGTVVSADGWQARNGSPTANVRSIKLSDGRTLWAGSSNTAVEEK